MSKTLLKNIFVYKNDKFEKGSLLIENGIVIAENATDEFADKIIDGTNKELYLFPGFFDLSMRITGLDHTSEVDLNLEVDKIIQSGITSALLMPDVTPNIDSIQVLNDIRRRLEKVHINFYPIASLSTLEGEDKKISEMFSLSDEGVIGFSDINRPILDNDFLYNSFCYASMVDKTIIKVAQEKDFSDGFVNDGKISDKWGLKSCLDIAESIATYKTIAVAKRLQNKLHLTSISTETALNVIKEFKKGDFSFTVDTNPAYFALNEEIMLENLSPKFKINPPLRAEKDRKSVVNAIKDGTIDVITSGHKLNSISSKNFDFMGSAFGTSSAFTYFPSISEFLYHQNKISKEKIVELTSITPRKLFNIEIPTIEIGNKLEHILVDFDEKFILKREGEKTNLNIFSNMELRGSVVSVFLNSKEF